jgi:hypothetical protein
MGFEKFVVEVVCALGLFGYNLRMPPAGLDRRER